MKRVFVLAAALAVTGPITTAQPRDDLSYASAAQGLATCVDMAQSGGAGVEITAIDTANQSATTVRLNGGLLAPTEGSGMKTYTALNFFQHGGDVAASLDQVPTVTDIPGILAVPEGQPTLGPPGTIIGAVGVAGLPLRKMTPAAPRWPSKR